MKLYTSYFGNVPKLASAGIVPVSISLYTPSWFHGVEYKELAPTFENLSLKYHPEQYTKAYQETILDRLSPLQVLRDLVEIGNGKDVAICCYEKPGSFCHRHLVSEWLNQFIKLKPLVFPLTGQALEPVTEFQKDPPLFALFENQNLKAMEGSTLLTVLPVKTQTKICDLCRHCESAKVYGHKNNRILFAHCKHPAVNYLSFQRSFCSDLEHNDLHVFTPDWCPVDKLKTESNAPRK